MTTFAWIGGIILLIIILSAINESVDRIYEPEEDAADWEARLSALMIINDLKYTRPDVWAKGASVIMGKPVNPPTPEQCEEYFKAHPDKRPK